MDNCNLVFDVNGYLPNGFRVFVKNIPLSGIETAVADMITATNKLIADGLTIEQPGLESLEPGQHRESVNGVMRRNYMEDDGTIVPVIDIYPDSPVLGRRCVFYYLDDETQIAEFEATTGLKLASMPVYTESQLNRVEKPELAKKFILPIKGGVSVVFKDNPAYDANASKKKAKHLFVRWETANAPTPPTQPPAAVAQVNLSNNHAARIIASTQEGLNDLLNAPILTPPPAPGDDWETQERLKAQTALNNELVTIFKVRYEPTQNGMGVERWTATARVLDGGTIPVTVYGEDANHITKAGYAWPKTDGDNLAIPVITALKGKDRRITYVEPAEANGAGANNLSEGEQKIIVDFMALPIAKAWKEVRQWLLLHVYDNKFHMDKSIEKWGKQTEGWKGMSAGEVMTYLADRHKEEKQPA